MIIGMRPAQYVDCVLGFEGDIKCQYPLAYYPPKAAPKGWAHEGLPFHINNGLRRALIKWQQCLASVWMMTNALYYTLKGTGLKIEHISLVPQTKFAICMEEIGADLECIRNQKHERFRITTPGGRVLHLDLTFEQLGVDDGLNCLLTPEEYFELAGDRELGKGSKKQKFEANEWFRTARASLVEVDWTQLIELYVRDRERYNSEIGSYKILIQGLLSTDLGEGRPDFQSPKPVIDDCGATIWSTASSPATSFSQFHIPSSSPARGRIPSRRRLLVPVLLHQHISSIKMNELIRLRNPAARSSGQDQFLIVTVGQALRPFSDVFRSLMAMQPKPVVQCHQDFRKDKNGREIECWTLTHNDPQRITSRGWGYDGLPPDVDAELRRTLISWQQCAASVWLMLSILRQTFSGTGVSFEQVWMRPRIEIAICYPQWGVLFEDIFKTPHEFIRVRTPNGHVLHLDLTIEQFGAAGELDWLLSPDMYRSLTVEDTVFGAIDLDETATSPWYKKAKRLLTTGLNWKELIKLNAEDHGEVRNPSSTVVVTLEPFWTASTTMDALITFNEPETGKKITVNLQTALQPFQDVFSIIASLRPKEGKIVRIERTVATWEKSNPGEVECHRPYLADVENKYPAGYGRIPLWTSDEVRWAQIKWRLCNPSVWMVLDALHQAFAFTNTEFTPVRCWPVPRFSVIAEKQQQATPYLHDFTGVKAHDGRWFYFDMTIEQLGGSHDADWLVPASAYSFANSMGIWKMAGHDDINDKWIRAAKDVMDSISWKTLIIEKYRDADGYEYSLKVVQEYLKSIWATSLEVDEHYAKEDARRHLFLPGRQRPGRIVD
ncbi:hypothetical protein M011DRAFT_457395 [Sporormia fimetaria CBS 119925]|uniref:Uncharacterized protein n=1 Tax=Sporormia fimetaria CBS 119925 TaxID=1340428 RepID=A0A6A6VFT3_9PLEO|nr:hypothetical protein M011DRAFT_457395 [Sporormia fimetaria CBS 119925]